MLLAIYKGKNILLIIDYQNLRNKFAVTYLIFAPNRTINTMKKQIIPQAILFLVLVSISWVSCKTEQVATQNASVVNKDFYKKMKADVLNEEDENYEEEENFFDNGDYIPSSPDANEKLIELGRIYEQDSSMIVKFDIRTAEELDGEEPEDTIIIGEETFTRNLHDITKSEIRSLRHNLNMIKDYKVDTLRDGGCQGKDCPVYAHVSKKDQRLYLYMNGEPLDTFKTSTGRAGHLTPDFNTKPNGRMFRKYTSHKFPGGNWNGLGNMPYAVFIQGGYAIHGTTVGSIPHLGNPASHGCIRIHPKNGKIFYNLVKYAGPENTWIVVDDVSEVKETASAEPANQ